VPFAVAVTPDPIKLIVLNEVPIPTLSSSTVIP
jgi:hypothetical protein